LRAFTSCARRVTQRFSHFLIAPSNQPENYTPEILFWFNFAHRRFSPSAPPRVARSDVLDKTSKTSGGGK
jgi:hypothetical protein